MISPPLISALILIGALVLFVSEKVRHDMVAVLALLACVFTGLIEAGPALAGFADPAVITVAAILVVGRGIELSGIAGIIARSVIPSHMSFGWRLGILLLIAAILSAFMNNIASLVITMPLATAIAREADRPQSAVLMPLAFSVILGGMCTMIGTPANLVISSIRQDITGTGFGFFSMAPVGGAVTVVGLIYLATLGWRILPLRISRISSANRPWQAFELLIPASGGEVSRMEILPRLRRCSARMLAAYREGERLGNDVASYKPGDKLMLIARNNQWHVADCVGMEATVPHGTQRDAVTARMLVGHGSTLIGASHDAVRTRSHDQLVVIAGGRRAARERMPLDWLQIQAGDELHLRGTPATISRFAAQERLVEIDRLDPMPFSARQATATLVIFLLTIAAIVGAGVSPAVAFLTAAVAMIAGRLVPATDVYKSIDWSIVVLLAAMIPVGQSFASSGAAAITATWLGEQMDGLPMFAILAIVCTVTMMLSVFLNNVTTALVIGPLAVKATSALGVPVDAVLLSVLIGASSDFLTPIGQQSTLLVMGPGGYKFSDYSRMGIFMVILVVLTSASVLTLAYG